MSKLLERMKKASTIKDSSVLADSIFFGKPDFVVTNVPALNIALSGTLEGGFTSGLTLWAGPSKHFKTCFTLMMMKAYLDKYPDAIALFYDSEFGSPQSYFSAFGIDISRVFHTPVTNIEELKFDLMKQLDEIKRGDKVFIALDSAGNIASKKEVDDAMDGKSVADMTRAKQMKSLFRMVTPHLTTKDIPMVVVNHIYMCGTENMQVITENGSIPLKDITKGMRVLTTNGYEEVSNAFAYDEAFVSDIELEDGTILSFTQGHRFKVNGEWVKVEDLKEGMFLDLAEI